MSKVLIVYGSTTGNTEWVAKEVAKVIKDNGHEVTLLNASAADPKGLCAAYDGVLFGCSTWGDSEIEFQDDFTSLFEEFAAIEVEGRKAATFGCGDDTYTYYCGAVDSIYDKLVELGAEVVADKLKINGDPDSAGAEIKTWAEAVAKKL